jgi:DNA-binding LytR/AlgR family response regulator
MESSFLKDRILVHAKGKTFWFEPDAICLFQGSGSYAIITLKNGEVIKTSKNLKHLMSRFPASCKQFFRVHRSFIVNLNYVEYLYVHSANKTMLHLCNGVDVPVSCPDVSKQLLSLYGYIEKEMVNELKVAKTRIDFSPAKNDDYIMISKYK